jgi:hypothetical protein
MRGYDALSILAEGLTWAIEREADYPSRPELHKRLTQIEDAARSLTEPRMLALLSNGDAQCEARLVGLASEVTDRVADVRKRHPPKKQGQGKLYPAAACGPDAREQCALIASMVWHRNEGKWPGQHNPCAQRDCEMLWVAAGGEPHGGVAARSGALTAWRRHIKAAVRYRPPHATGKLIERILRGGPAPKPRPPWLTGGVVITPRRSWYRSKEWRRDFPAPRGGTRNRAPKA